MKKGLTVFAISTLLCGGLAIADGGNQAFAKGGKGSSSSSSSHTFIHIFYHKVSKQ